MTASTQEDIIRELEADWPAEASIADRADDPEPEVELFPHGSLDGDPEVTIAKLVRRGLPVEVTASIRSAEVPLRQGMLSPERSGRVVVSYVLEKVELVAKRDGDEVIGWKVRQVLRPTYVQHPESATSA